MSSRECRKEGRSEQRQPCGHDDQQQRKSNNGQTDSAPIHVAARREEKKWPASPCELYFSYQSPTSRPPLLPSPPPLVLDHALTMDKGIALFVFLQSTHCHCHPIAKETKVWIENVNKQRKEISANQSSSFKSNSVQDLNRPTEKEILKMQYSVKINKAFECEI